MSGWDRAGALVAVWLLFFRLGAFAGEAGFAGAFAGVAEGFVEGGVGAFGGVGEDSGDDELGLGGEGFVGGVARGDLLRIVSFASSQACLGARRDRLKVRGRDLVYRGRVPAFVVLLVVPSCVSRAAQRGVAKSARNSLRT